MSIERQNFFTEDEIMERFYEFDFDHSGSIDVHELDTFMQTLFSDTASIDSLRAWTLQTLNEIETRHAGMLDFDEFVHVHNKAVLKFRSCKAGSNRA